MNLKFSIFLFLILALLGVGIWFSLDRAPGEQRSIWTTEPKSIDTPTYAEIELEKKEQSEKDTLNYNKAIELSDETLCTMIIDTQKSTQCRDMIRVALSLKSENPDLCKDIEDQVILGRCRDGVYFRIAETKKDQDACKNISDENIQGNCEDMFAVEDLENAIASGSLTGEICDSFSGEVLKEQCQERLLAEADNRAYRKAMESKKLDECDPIYNTDLKDRCRDALILDRAISTSDPSLCDSIVDPTRSKYCQSTLATRNDVGKYQEFIKNNNLEGCRTLMVDSMKRQCHDTITFSRVRETQDDTLCMTLYNTGIIDRCHAMIRK